MNAMDTPCPGDCPAISAIAALVAEYFGLTLEQIRSPERTRRVAWARHAAWALTREVSAATASQIGAFYGRDHATVLHGLVSAKERRLVTPELRERVEANVCAEPVFRTRRLPQFQHREPGHV